MNTNLKSVTELEQLQSLASQTKPLQGLIKRINRKLWWHVQPQDPDAYKKRGKFLSSSYDEAEFYGRPGDPERVVVNCPLVGDETHIELTLFGYYPSGEMEQIESGMATITARLALDAKIKEAAVAEGYDSIALMTPRAWQKFLSEGKMPRSIELNIFA